MHKIYFTAQNIPKRALEVWFMEPSDIKTLVGRSCEKFGDKAAFLLRNEDKEKLEISYSQLKKDMDCFGTAMVCSLGLKGEKVGIMGANSYFWCLSYLTVTSGVGVAVPMDKEAPVEELSNMLSLAGVRAVAADREAAEKIRQTASYISGQVILIPFEKDEDNSVTELITMGEELMKKGNEEYTSENPSADKLALILFTSGTTGMAKGVMLTHGNICSDLVNVRECVDIGTKDVSLSLLPLHHTYEAIAFLMIIYSGGAISFARSVRHLREDFSFYRPTVFVTVPLILERLHRRIVEGISGRDSRKKLQMLSAFSSALSDEKKKKLFSQVHEVFGGRLEKIICGAAALQSEVAEDFRLFGIPVIIGYGLTECSPIVICNRFSEPTTNSIGKPLRDVQVRLINTDEKGIGEICVKGPMVMKGYYENEAETQRAFIDGFFRTGDMGYRDKNGNYHITGRKKNVIVTKNGKNIYPEELEYYLSRHRVVADSLVYAESDHIICAEIIADEKEVGKKYKKDNPDKADIDRAVTEAVRLTNKKLPSYKSIRKVIVRKNDFDRTSTHKIKR